MKCPVEQFLNRAKFDRWSKYFPASRTAFNSAFEMWFFSSNNVYIGAPSVVTERSLVEGLLEQWMVEQTGHDIIWPKNIGFRKYSKCSVWNINIQFCSILERVSESGALESEKTLFENLFGARKAIKWESFWPGPHWSSWWWFVSSLPISYYTSALTPLFQMMMKCFRQRASDEVLLKHSSPKFLRRQNLWNLKIDHL